MRFDAAHLLDLVPHAVFLLRMEPLGAVALRNRAAGTLKGLGVDPNTGLLRANCQIANRQIHKALRMLPKRRSTPVLLIPCPEHNETFCLSIGPTSQGWIPVSVFPPQQPLSRAGLEAFQECYGISAGEMRLAEAVLAGETASAAGARLGISRNTAKSQLSAVFQKTQCRSQNELTRLFFQGPFAHMASDVTQVGDVAAAGSMPYSLFQSDQGDS